MIENEEVLQYVTTQEEDKEGLGRWSWMGLSGSGSATRIITAHIPYTTRKKAIDTTIVQHRRHWRLQAECQYPSV